MNAERIGRTLPLSRCEPTQLRFLAQAMSGPHQVDIGFRASLRRFGAQGDQLGDPIVIDRRAPAIARQQRRRHARNAGQQHFVQRLFQHVQASDADNRIDVAADDDFQNDRRPLGNQHLVSEFLGRHLEVGHRTGAALLAIETEFVVIGRAAFGVFQTMRQEQQPAFEIDGGNLFPPKFVGQRDHREAKIGLGHVQPAQQFLTHRLQDRFGQRLRTVDGLAEILGGRADTIAQLPRLGNGLQVSGAGTLAFWLGLNLDSRDHSCFLKVGNPGGSSSAAGRRDPARPP